VDSTGQQGTWHYAATMVPTALSVGREVVDGIGEPYLMRPTAYKRYPVGGLRSLHVETILSLAEMYGEITFAIWEPWEAGVL